MPKSLFVSILTIVALVSSPAFADGTPSTKDKPAAEPTPDWDIAFGGSVASDYVFRGISQSNRWPSGSGYTEFRYNPLKNLQLYAASSVESIDFPNRAAAEVDFYGGVRPTLGKLGLDIGAQYYWYPGGQQFNGLGPNGPNVNCTNRFKINGACNIYEADLSFYEVYGKASYTVNDIFTFGGNIFYSPSWLNEGADGTYASGTAKITAPNTILPRFMQRYNIGAFLSGEAGYYWFGRTNAFYGNIELPDYSTWNAGGGFTYKIWTLDFRYYDTDLSRANCNVLTADHTATFNPSNITPLNPSGLGSNWCGAAFVAKLSVDLTANTNLK